jgi:hypothetical protein
LYKAFSLFSCALQLNYENNSFLLAILGVVFLMHFWQEMTLFLNNYGLLNIISVVFASFIEITAYFH